MRILFVGDIFAEYGMKLVLGLVEKLRREHELDLIVANAENAAHGLGLSARQAQQLLDAGIDGLTLGNHAFRQRDLLPLLNSEAKIVRPANFPAQAPGRGLMFLERGDVTVAVINLLGGVYLQAAHSPFDAADGLVEQARARTPVILVDLHAEATSEKVALAHHLSGKVSAVVGTHTHVQTSDARILGGHTAYITDLGMTGVHDSVIGVEAGIILKRFTTGIGGKFVPAAGRAQLEGAIIDIDTDSGRATQISAVRIPQQEQSAGTS